MRNLLLSLTLAGTAFFRPAVAETPQLGLQGQPYVLGPVFEQTVAGGTYLHLDCETNLAGLGTQIQALVPKLKQALGAARTQPMGPLEVIYHGLDGNPETRFRMEVGFLVPEGTQAAGEARTRVLLPFHCASMTFTGKVADLGQAYGSLYGSLHTSGKTPSEESRQMILYWEGPASTNDLLLIQAGIR
ncbi:MAG TPA: GyrI-like domain-containing protein [Holophagaceae bacterium]